MQISYELLLRMKDEDGNTVSPGTFLPAAERYGIAPKLDRWVVKNALQSFTKYPDLLSNISTVSINLSGLSLADEEFLEFIIQTLDKTQIPPEKICFEITETAAIENLNNANYFIKTLKELGCYFALDDFGSGLSSFAYLKSLPVDYLKIDGLFVRGMADDETDFIMVKSIKDIGHVMGKKIIAEFVETAAIMEKLEELGVDYVQGFGIGRPQSLDSIDLDTPLTQLTSSQKLDESIYLKH